MGFPEEVKDDAQFSEPLLRHSPEELVQPRKPIYRLAWVLACAIVFSLGAAILAFPLGFQKGRHFAQLPEVLTPIPKFPTKDYTFAPSDRYINDEMFDDIGSLIGTLHQWVNLSADGRGMLYIEDYEQYNLAPPYKMAVTDNSRFLDVHFVSVFHQLHCLSIIIEAFYHARAGPPGVPGGVSHYVHCFEYLRQSIMCSADTTLEGHTGMGNGWGSIHRCTDYDALLHYMNERTVLPFNNKPPNVVI